MSDTCPWWIRWWHQRMRASDRATMFPVFTRQCRARFGETRDGVLMRRRLLLTFMNERGQEHWRCSCAQRERRDVLEFEPRADRGGA